MSKPPVPQNRTKKRKPNNGRAQWRVTPKGYEALNDGRVVNADSSGYVLTEKGLIWMEGYRAAHGEVQNHD